MQNEDIKNKIKIIEIEFLIPIILTFLFIYGMATQNDFIAMMVIPLCAVSILIVKLLDKIYDIKWEEI